MAEPRAGLGAAEALGCLLRLNGHEEPLATFQDAHGPDLAPEAMVPVLGRQGLQARPARIQSGDLAYLPLPALARHRDGSWLVLQARVRKGWRLLAAGGPAVLGAQELWAAMDGLVLDLSPGLPAGGGLWRRLRGLLAHHRRALALVVAASVLIQALGLVTPALTGVVMDRALPDGAGSMLALVAAGVALMALGHAACDLVRGRALLHLTQRLSAAAERGFLEHVLGLPFKELRRRPAGAWLQAFDGFAAARDLLAEGTVAVLLDGAFALVLLATMAWLLPGPAAAVACAALTMAAASVLAGRAEVRLQAQEVEVQVREQGCLAEVLAGIATLKAAGVEAQALRRWRPLFRKGLRLGLRRGRIGLWNGTALGGLGHGVDAALLVWGGLQVVRGELGLGAFLAFLQLASAFTAALLGLAGTWLELLVLGPQLARASAILELPVPSPPADLGPAAGPEPVAMKDVWFRYRPEGLWVLRGLDLHLEAGAKHRLSAPSGWGKSTVLRLLAGLETPEKGEILIGGRPPAQARQRIIHLPQFVQLHGGSILENLVVLSGGAPPEALLRAAARTGLDAWVATLPMGFKTLLPPGAGNLSGGQRQWIALTAALASGRGLLLLDEPLANLDPIVAARLGDLLDAGAWTLVAAGLGEGG